MSELLAGTHWLIHADHAERGRRRLEAAHRLARRMAEDIEPAEVQACLDGEGAAAEPSFDDGSTRVVRLEGVMVAGAGLPRRLMSFMGLTDTHAVKSLVERAAADAKVKRIVLYVDSPGGQVSGVAELARAVETAGKPVEACVWGMCASAAYWVAAAASSVTVVPTAMVGSVGAVVTVTDSRPGREKLEFVSSQTPRKRQNPFDEDEGRRSAARASLQAMADSLGDVFVSYVRKRRGDHGGRLDGGMYVGREAIDNGYADGVAFLSEVLTRHRRKERRMTTEAQGGTADKAEELVSTGLVTTVSGSELGAEAGASLEPARENPSAAEAVKAIMALPGSDAAKLEAVAQGMTVEEAAQHIIDSGSAAGGERIRAREGHEGGTSFPSGAARPADGEDSASVAAECVAMFERHGSAAGTQALA